MIGRTAAVDYGRRRIGLAVCDPLGITVRGLETVRTGGAPAGAGGAPALAEAVREVARRLAAEEVVRVVVGLPLHEDGSESERSKEARAFATALGVALGTPVDLHDEGLTSWAAEEDVKGAGKRLEDARAAGEIDRAAAVAILRSWLEERASGGEAR